MTGHSRLPRAAAAFRRSQEYFGQGDYDRALVALTEAISVEPDFWEAHAALGQLYSRLGDQHRARHHGSYAEWLEHRLMLEPYRVGPGDRRTTSPPPFDAGSLFPEIAGRRATAVRLHPRYGDEPPTAFSKLGGTFLWPAAEPWPVCPAHHIPYVGVLQLRASDFPEMPFPDGTDLFQMLWCPRDHEGWPMCWADPKFFWRNAAAVTDPLPANPAVKDAYYEYVPFPCRLMPERVTEYPSVYDLSDEVNERIDEWQNQHLDENGKQVYCYETDLSVCYGTKIGGYVHWIQFPWIPTCQCGQLMQHLLTVASVEWNGLLDERWTPQEEQPLVGSLAARWDQLDERGRALHRALWMPTGLSLGDAGQMQLFVCQRCSHMPIVPNIESS